MAADTAARPTALVLAAARRGVEDPVAQMQGKSHKCLVEIDGRVMLERVVEALIESGKIGRILISIEHPELLRATPRLAAWVDDATIAFVESRETLADSVLALSDAAPDVFPLVVTTGDNVLHTPELIREFADRFLEGEAEVAVAFTSQATVMSAHPEVGLAYHRLKDGGWSACNLYGLRTAESLKLAEIFRSGGQFGKRHWRILKAFGAMPFILYKLGAATLDGLMRRIARNLGTTAQAIVLDYPFGPIDVDNPQFFRIAEDILRRRRESGGG